MGGDQGGGGKQGAGLGLAIVQRIVALHEGRIGLTNHPEGGLEVKVALPLEKNPRRPKLRGMPKPGKWKRNGKGTH